MDSKLMKEQICDIGQKMWLQGWVAANDGNIWLFGDSCG